MIDSTYIVAGRVESTNQAHSTFAMPAYIAVDITVEDPPTYERYKTLAPPSIAKYGGRYDAKALRQSCARTDMVLLDGPAFDPAKPAG